MCIRDRQIEHVCEALATIAAEPEENGTDPAANRLAEMQTGLTIQSYQLRNARETVRGWVAQIRTCLEGIAHIAS